MVTGTGAGVIGEAMTSGIGMWLLPCMASKRGAGQIKMPSSDLLLVLSIG